MQIIELENNCSLKDLAQYCLASLKLYFFRFSRYLNTYGTYTEGGRSAPSGGKLNSLNSGGVSASASSSGHLHRSHFPAGDLH